MNYKDKNLVKRILDISYKNKLSHLGSYFSCLDIIDDIFNKKKEDDIFILSSDVESDSVPFKLLPNKHLTYYEYTKFKSRF